MKTQKKSTVLNLVMSAAVSLLIAIGYANASSWDADTCLKKIKRLPKSCPKPEDSPATGDDLETLRQVLEADAAGAEICIVADESEDEDDEESDDDESEDEGDEESDDEESDDEESDDEESEDEDDEESEDEDDEESDDEESEDEDDEEPAPAPAKSDKKKSAKAEEPKADKKKSDKKSAKAEEPKADKKSSKKSDKKPAIQKVGVIDAIVEILSGASKANPIEKSVLLDGLAEKFPGRAREAMKGTVNVQVPWGLRKKGIDVQKIDKGFYIAKPGKKAKAEEPAPAPAKSDKKKSDKKSAKAEEPKADKKSSKK